MGLGLIVLYGVVTLVRGVLEPRLLGKRIGLPPLVSLVSMYVGFQIFGVLGMILMPVLAMMGCRSGWTGMEGWRRKRERL